MIICSWGHYRCMTGYLDALARALMETSNCCRRVPLYYANFNASKNFMGLLQNALIFEIWPAIIRPKCDLFMFQWNLNIVLYKLTMFAGVMDFNIFVGSWAGVSEDCAVYRNMTGCRPLAPGSDNPQSPRGHTVDWPIRISVHVADGNWKPSIVRSNDI